MPPRNIRCEEGVRVGDGRLRVIVGEAAPVVETRDPRRFQAECVEAFVASWTARGFSQSTIANDVGVLERMLVALARPVWEATADDVDRVVGELASSGRAVSTRRNYLQVFKGFHRFLEVRKAAGARQCAWPAVRRGIVRHRGVHFWAVLHPGRRYCDRRNAPGPAPGWRAAAGRPYREFVAPGSSRANGWWSGSRFPWRRSTFGAGH